MDEMENSFFHVLDQNHSKLRSTVKWKELACNGTKQMVCEVELGFGSDASSFLSGRTSDECLLGLFQYLARPIPLGIVLYWGLSRLLCLA